MADLQALNQGFWESLRLADNEMMHVRLGFVDPREIDSDWKNPYDQLAGMLWQFILEVKEHKIHMCEFNDDDYCIVCGLDGRA